jgi:hypothetical protein
LLWVKHSSSYQEKEFHANFELIKANVMLKSSAHLASICTQVPSYGIFENISSISQLAAMPQWTEDRPLRVVTGYTYVCPISPCSQGGSILGFVLFCQSLVHVTLLLDSKF